MALPHVSSEGGPILIVDAELLGNWRGIDGDDYRRACSVVESSQTPDGGVVTINNGEGLVWNIGGPGSAFVIRNSGRLPALVRYWSNGDLTEEALRSIVTEIELERQKVLGHLNLSSGRVAIVWAVENGKALKLPSDEGRIYGDTSIEDSGYMMKLPEGRYALLFVESVALGAQFKALTFRLDEHGD